MEILKKDWKNYNVQEFLLQLKNEWIEVLDLMALFLLKTGPCDAKNWWEISVDAKYCFNC